MCKKTTARQISNMMTNQNYRTKYYIMVLFFLNKIYVILKMQHITY